jgi:penicillin-binding protein 2
MLARDVMRDHQQESRMFGRRVLVTAIGGLILLGVLGARLTFLQIASHEHFSTLSHENRVRIQPVPPTRGLIYDRNGVLLADNLPSYQLQIVPEQVPDLEQTLTRLQRLVELDETHLERFNKLRKRHPGHNGIPLKLNLSDTEMARVAINLHTLPGVHLEAALTRHYPKGELGVHLIGYVGRISEQELETIDVAQYRGTTHIGKNGVERAYENLLHGQVGYQQAETNAQGRMLRILSQTPPGPGSDLHLTIDIQLQEVAENALGDYNGAVVAIDPRNGEVLAMASQPGFDPNLFVQGIGEETFKALNTSKARPLFNRALRGTYPPGSTIKPLVGLAGLHYGVVDADHSINCPGFYKLPNNKRKYRDWKRWGHGRTNLDKGVVQSCDVYFYDLGRHLGIERIHDFLAQFTIGQRTGLDFGNERSGVLPNEAWKRANYNEAWYTGETLIAAIGQGFVLATPLQLANAMAILANRGEAYRPHVLQWSEIPGEDNPETLALTPIAPVIVKDPDYWDDVIRAMTRVVHSERGTARKIAKDFPYRIAGKTGTAQVFSLGQEEEYDADKLSKELHDHALFVAFAPADAPRIALAVVAENGGSGSGVAAPIARAVLGAWDKLERGEPLTPPVDPNSEPAVPVNTANTPAQPNT